MHKAKLVYWQCYRLRIFKFYPLAIFVLLHLFIVAFLVPKLRLVCNVIVFISASELYFYPFSCKPSLVPRRSIVFIEIFMKMAISKRARVLYTQPETRKLQQVCCRLAASIDHQVDIRMRSHRLLRLDDNKSAASCQQVCCKLRTADLLQVVNCGLAANCELQTCCKL